MSYMQIPFKMDIRKVALTRFSLNFLMTPIHIKLHFKEFDIYLPFGERYRTELYSIDYIVGLIIKNNIPLRIKEGVDKRLIEYIEKRILEEKLNAELTEKEREKSVRKI